MKFKLIESLEDTEFYFNKILENCLITEDLSPDATSLWILPNGKYLWALNKNRELLIQNSNSEHVNVDQWLQKEYNLSSEDARKCGQENIENHNCIRFSFFTNTFTLNKTQPTFEQYESIYTIIEYVYDRRNSSYFYNNIGLGTNDTLRSYQWSDGYTPEDILKLIKRYYTSGILYEELLNEDWYKDTGYGLSRSQLIAKIKNLGYKHIHFDKYSDQRLFKIFNSLNKKHLEQTVDISNKNNNTYINDPKYNFEDERDDEYFVENI